MAIIIPALPYTLTNGTTADANQVMADLNDIVSGVNTNAAHNGPNSDITSLTGLTTPLSIPQGGTGVGAVGVAGTIPVSDGLAFAWSTTVNGPLTITGAVNLNGAPNNIKGVTDLSNAAAGYVGEFITTSGGPVGLASATAANCCTLTLQPGDWNVWGIAQLTPSVNMSSASVGITIASATFQVPYFALNIAGLTTSILSAPMQRISISTVTTVWVVVQVAFASGTVSATGNIYARRVR
jgi:hypothetical protein